MVADNCVFMVSCMIVVRSRQCIITSYTAEEFKKKKVGGGGGVGLKLEKNKTKQKQQKHIAGVKTKRSEKEGNNT